jgi:hypothetical protein
MLYVWTMASLASFVLAFAVSVVAKNKSPPALVSTSGRQVEWSTT